MGFRISARGFFLKMCSCATNSKRESVFFFWKIKLFEYKYLESDLRQIDCMAYFFYFCLMNTSSPRFWRLTYQSLFFGSHSISHIWINCPDVKWRRGLYPPSLLYNIWKIYNNNLLVLSEQSFGRSPLTQVAFAPLL